MDCLVLGGHGYLGSRIFDFLNTSSNNVTIGSETFSKNESTKLNIISNYRNLDDDQLINLTQNFDLIIDATGISSSQTCNKSVTEVIQFNSFWPARLVNACIKNQTRLVWFSTFHCEKLNINDQPSIRKNIYQLSKVIAESSIFEIEGWDEFISVIRLGNMIGAPGNLYLGNSSLFSIDITKNLIINSMAKVRSDASKKIGFVPISDLLNSKFFSIPGFYTLYSKNEISLFTIANLIRDSYEKLSGEKGHILFDISNDYHIIKEFISKDIRYEIDLMVKYFLENK